MFHYTVETEQSVSEAVQTLERALQEAQFGVLWQLDIQQTLQEKGFAIDGAYRVLEVCNPQAAQRVLSRNREVGYFLPCKIVVYDDDGTTKIGLTKPTFLMEAINDPSLHAIAADIEKRLIACIDQSK